MAKGKGSNPVDSFRKLQRAKELKKNKENRSKIRENQVVRRDTRDLETEIKELKGRPKLASADADRLKSLETELAYVNKVKEKYVSEHPEARDRIFRKHNPNGGPRGAPGIDDDRQDGEADPSGSGGGGGRISDMNHLYDERGRLRDPKRSVYYHEVYNPYGVPPPGMPYRERTPSEADEDEEDSDGDEEDGSDDDIVMPEGPPPGADAESDEDSDDSDDIPLPAGPPPPRPLDPASIPTGPRSNVPQMRPPLHFTGPSGSGAPPLPHAPGPPGPSWNPGHSGFPRAGPQGQPPLPPVPPVPSPYQPHFGQMAPWGALQAAGPSLGTSARPPHRQRQQQHGAPSVQDPLSDAPTQTYQGHRMVAQAGLPARPPAPVPVDGGPRPGLPEKPGSPAQATSKKPPSAPSSDVLAAATVTAAPQLRDLRKEAVAFVPRGVKRKAGAGGAGSGTAGMGRVNATPGSGEIDEDGDEVRVKRQEGPGLLGVLKGVLGDGASSRAVPGKGAATTAAPSGDDDYQKFLDGLSDLA